MLRRQFRWTTAALLRFGRDLQCQTTRRGWASLDVWSKILAMMRNGTLPSKCQTTDSAACAAACFLLANDEEGWRIKQAVFGALDPDNLGDWRHSRPGRQSRWENVWVSLAGARWKERLLAGELRNFEEEFICEGMSMVGRVRELPCRTLQEAGDFRAPLELGGTLHRAVVHPADGAGISRGGLRYASPSCESCLVRVEICMDCDNIVRWSNGTWKLYNDRYEDPLLQVMDKVARLRDFGCRPRGVGSDWLAHIPRSENRRADHLAAHPSDD